MLTVSVFISGAGWLPSGVSEPLPGYGTRSSLPSDEMRNVTATPRIPANNEPSEGPQSHTLLIRALTKHSVLLAIAIAIDE